MNFSFLLWGMVQALRVTKTQYPEFAAHLKERDLVAQFRLKDQPEGRWIKLASGKISTGKGIHDKPDLTIGFKNKAIAEEGLTPPCDQRRRMVTGRTIQDVVIPDKRT